MMPFKLESVTEVIQRARNAFKAELPGSDAWLFPNNIYVSAKVIGGSVWHLMGHLRWIDKQRFVATATGSEILRHAADYGMSLKPPTYARGSVILSAAYPHTFASGLSVSRSDGATYTLDAAASVSAGTGTALAPVTASLSGSGGNAVAGSPFTAAGATAVVVSNDGVGGGSDGETLEQLRARVLDRKRQPPHGGAGFDYVKWALEVPGVTRAFVSPLAYGPGTVGVYFLMDDTYPNGFPQPVDVAAVQAHIAAVKPVQAIVIVAAPQPYYVDVVVSALYPDTDAVRTGVAAELKSMFAREAYVSLRDNTFTLYQSWIWQAVSNATGERHHDIIAPTQDISVPVGAIPCLRSVRFI